VFADFAGPTMEQTLLSIISDLKVGLPHMDSQIHNLQTELPDLAITPDAAFAILLKARQFDVKVAQTDPDSGSNPSDDNSVDVLEFGPSDNTRIELVTAIHDLNDDEQTDLLALIFLGRGDFALVEWIQAKQAAKQNGRKHIAKFFSEIPLVSDYLEEGLSLFDEPLQDYVDAH
jgi:hypothetical protein